MNRRRFVFWISLGIFGLAEKLRAGALDELAASILRSTGSKRIAPAESTSEAAAPEHWTSATNNTWHWYEREKFIEGRWKLTGITTPINNFTGERYAGRNGYLDESLVPAEVRGGYEEDRDVVVEDSGPETAPGKPDPARRARHGRPPSKWLRSLHADELRIWLRTIDVPEAGVSGMSFLTHLTRDHSFREANVIDLTSDEQALLHAAAHYGY
ncbi:MAG TPA: hypothetical protein VGG64_09530 [Pirellulales bacterium]|jgi:hypothetical protein